MCLQRRNHASTMPQSPKGGNETASMFNYGCVTNLLSLVTGHGSLMNDPLDMLHQAVVLMIVVGAPVLLVGLAVALVVGLVQALTQLQEQTLSFVPKILAMLAAVLMFGGWMMTRLVEFAQRAWGS